MWIQPLSAAAGSSVECGWWQCGTVQGEGGRSTCDTRTPRGCAFVPRWRAARPTRALRPAAGDRCLAGDRGCGDDLFHRCALRRAPLRRAGLAGCGYGARHGGAQRGTDRPTTRRLRCARPDRQQLRAHVWARGRRTADERARRVWAFADAPGEDVGGGADECLDHGGVVGGEPGECCFGRRQVSDGDAGRSGVLHVDGRAGSAPARGVGLASATVSLPAEARGAKRCKRCSTRRRETR